MLSRRGLFGLLGGAAAAAVAKVSPAAAAPPPPPVWDNYVNRILWGVEGTPAGAGGLLDACHTHTLTPSRYDRMVEIFKDIRGQELPPWPYPSIREAANLPVPPKGVTVEQMREAIADQERRKKLPQKKFEDLLSAPIGKGRLE